MKYYNVLLLVKFQNPENSPISHDGNMLKTPSCTHEVIATDSGNTWFSL